MSDAACSRRFINSKEVHRAILSDEHFAKRVPNEFTEGMRNYVLEVVNSLCGGEFELIVEHLHIYLLSLMDKDKKQRKKK
jgi:hypothetical protein